MTSAALPADYRNTHEHRAESGDKTMAQQTMMDFMGVRRLLTPRTRDVDMMRKHIDDVLVRFHLLVTDNREVWKSNKFCCKMVVQRGFPPLSVRLVTYTLEEAPRFLQPSARLMVMNLK